jgi:hypothetical protein
MTRTPSDPLEIASVLSQDASLQGVVRRAAALAELDVALRQALPAATARQCRVLNVRDGSLVVMARSSVFAGRVRVAQGALIARAQTLGLEVSQVLVRVGGWELPEPPSPAGTPLSARAAEELLKTAEELGEENPLSQALRGLAATLKKSQPG